MAVTGMSAQIKMDNAPAYVSSKMKQFLEYYKTYDRYTTQWNRTSNSTLKNSQPFGAISYYLVLNQKFED